MSGDEQSNAEFAPSSFVCVDCSSVYAHRQSLDDHRKRVHAAVPRRYKCAQCDKSYPTRRSRQRHALSHASTLPYACTLCPLAFATGYQLKAHTQTHSPAENGKRRRKRRCISATAKTDGNSEIVPVSSPPFACDLCDKTFGRESALIAHRLTHPTLFDDGRRLWRCEECNKTFSNKGNKSRHCNAHCPARQTSK